MFCNELKVQNKWEIGKDFVFVLHPDAINFRHFELLPFPINVRRKQCTRKHNNRSGYSLWALLHI